MQEALTSLNSCACIHTTEDMVLEIPMRTDDEQHTVKSRLLASFQRERRWFLTLKPLFTLPLLWTMTKAAQILPLYSGPSSSSSSSFTLRTWATFQVQGKASLIAVSPTAEAGLPTVGQKLHLSRTLVHLYSKTCFKNAQTHSSGFVHGTWLPMLLTSLLVPLQLLACT